MANVQSENFEISEISEQTTKFPMQVWPHILVISFLGINADCPSLAVHGEAGELKAFESDVVGRKREENGRKRGQTVLFLLFWPPSR
jgi:hypothetical protein